MRSSSRPRAGRPCSSGTPTTKPESGSTAARKRALRERREQRLRAIESPTPAAASPGATASGHLLRTHTTERQEFLYSLIGLTVKLGLVAVAGVSLFRLAGAYQARMDRQGEIAAVLDLEKEKLDRARQRFDQLFTAEGEQRLIREQSQWIAPDRMRVVWQPEQRRTAEKHAALDKLPTVETAAGPSGRSRPAP